MTSAHVCDLQASYSQLLRSVLCCSFVAGLLFISPERGAHMHVTEHEDDYWLHPGGHGCCTKMQIVYRLRVSMFIVEPSMRIQHRCAFTIGSKESAGAHDVLYVYESLYSKYNNVRGSFRKRSCSILPPKGTAAAVVAAAEATAP